MWKICSHQRVTTNSGISTVTVSWHVDAAVGGLGDTTPDDLAEPDVALGGCDYSAVATAVFARVLTRWLSDQPS